MPEQDLNYDYLAMIQEQMEVRRSKDFPKKLCDTKERCSEYLAFSLCWNEYIKLIGGFFQSFDSGKYKEIWIKTEKHRLKGAES